VAVFLDALVAVRAAAVEVVEQPLAAAESRAPDRRHALGDRAYPARVANTHSCNRSPPTPSGSVRLCVGPAAYPSSETEKLCTRSFGMALPSIKD
jgi:hypothetical protein